MAKRRRKKTRTAYINGQRWRITRAKLRDRYGDCDYGQRLIRIHDTLAGVELMDTLLHELIHARWPDLLEESVSEFASTLASVLDAEGFAQEADRWD